MEKYDPERMELAPRDIVARANDDQIKRYGLDFVHLDISHQPPEFVAEHFPTIHEKLLGLGDFDCFLLAGRYTLLEQEALETFLPLCVKRDVGIILGGPYNSGILATGPVEGARYNYAPAPAEILDKVRKMEAVCASHDTPLIAAALQFVLGHPAVRSVIPGGANAKEVKSNVALLERPIPVMLWQDLRREGLIRSDAPLPGDHTDVA